MESEGLQPAAVVEADGFKANTDPESASDALKELEAGNQGFSDLADGLDQPSAAKLDQPSEASAPKPAGAYARVLAHYPLATIAGLTLFLLATSAIGFAVGGIPDFGSADKGFEARGTSIGGKVQAERRIANNEFENLMYWKGQPAEEYYGDYYGDYYGGDEEDDRRELREDRRRLRIKRLSREDPRMARKLRQQESVSSAQRAQRLSAERRNFTTSLRGADNNDMCVFSAARASVVGAAQDGLNLMFENTGDDPRGLFNLASVKYMCEIADAFLHYEMYDEVCLKAMPYMQGSPGNGCCRPRSLGHWIIYSGALRGCEEIEQSHLDDALQLAKTCAPWFRDGTARKCIREQIEEEAEGGWCDAMPAMCSTHVPLVALSDLFFILADQKWLNPEEDNPEKLDTANLLIPLDGYPHDGEIVDSVDTERLKEFFKLADRWFNKDSDGAKLVAYGMSNGDDDAKFDLFNEQLIVDTVFGVGAAIVVTLLLWLHTGSAFIAGMSMLQIVLNMGTSYFLYVCILQMPFFPFLNLTSLFVIIGIGADDVFVFVDAWKQSFHLLPKTTEIADRLGWTVRRAGSAMFVTSFTTAVDFGRI